MKLTYFVTIEEPHLHLLKVEMAISEITDNEIMLTMPAWTPGSYLIRDFARNVRNLSAHTSDGRILEARKKDKSSWKILTAGSTDLRISYHIFCEELSIRSTHLDASHAFILGTSAFMYMEGYKDQALEISFNIPADWHISTSLEKTIDNVYHAINYDVLVDSPVEIGKHLSGIFTVDGKEHEVAIYGQFNGDLQKIINDMQKIVEATLRIFEHAPYKRYVFILQSYQGNQTGGLEHSASCVVSMDPSMIFDDDYYKRLMSVIAHEYFHTWNVKRIRPVELGPFNYKEENYTSLLWFSEGVTDYFADLIILRAKIIDQSKFLEFLGESIKMIEFMPGSLETSLADSSFDTWIRLYKPSPDDVNSYISYYLKGKVIGLLMSKKIATLTSGGKSLDNLLLLLYEKFRKDGKGFTEKDLITALKDLSGEDFNEFFNRFIRGTEKIDFDSELADMGLKIDRTHSVESRAQLSWAGMIVKHEGAAFTVSAVIKGKPSYRAGINSGDEIVAINGIRFKEDNTSTMLKSAKLMLDSFRSKAGEKVNITIFRRNTLMSILSEAEPLPFDTYKITEVPGQDDKKKIMDRVLLITVTL